MVRREDSSLRRWLGGGRKWAIRLESPEGSAALPTFWFQPSETPRDSRTSTAYLRAVLCPWVYGDWLWQRQGTESPHCSLSCAGN